MAEGEIWQMTFLLSSTALSFSIVCCLLSFCVCFLHTLFKRCAISFPFIPSQALYSKLQTPFWRSGTFAYIFGLEKELFWKHLMLFPIWKQSSHYTQQGQWKNFGESKKIQNFMNSREVVRIFKIYIEVLSF